MFVFFEKISERIPERGIEVLSAIPESLLEKIDTLFTKKCPKNNLFVL